MERQSQKREGKGADTTEDRSHHKKEKTEVTGTLCKWMTTDCQDKLYTGI